MESSNFGIYNAAFMNSFKYELVPINNEATNKSYGSIEMLKPSRARIEDLYFYCENFLYFS